MRTGSTLRGAFAVLAAASLAACSGSRSWSGTEVGDAPEWTGRAWRPHYAFRFPMPELERFEGSLVGTWPAWAQQDLAYLRTTAAQIAGKYDDVTHAAMPDTLDATERARTMDAVCALGGPVLALREAAVDPDLGAPDLLTRVDDVKEAFEGVRATLLAVVWRSGQRRALDGFYEAFQPVSEMGDVAAVRRAAPELKARAEELTIRALPEGVRWAAALNAQRSYQQLATATGKLFRASIDGHPQPIVDAHAEVREAYVIAVERTGQAFATATAPAAPQ
jgi:hypothetical protein